MDKIILLLILLSIPLIFIYARGILKSRRRVEISAREFPSEWESLLRKRVPFYLRMPEELRIKLRRHMAIFLSEKSFEGCRGQKIDDEVRVLVSAYACILLLNRETDYYPELTSMLIYPDAYWVNDEIHIAGQTIKSKAVNFGESWENGAVILSWKQIMDEVADENCGQSLIIHEFAHQLDAEDGFLNGLPELGEGSSYGQWSKVFSKEYEDLRDAGEEDEDDVIDRYGRKDPAEFFAVVTEGFFLRASEMKGRHPELYEEMVKFYKVDPSSWNDNY